MSRAALNPHVAGLAPPPIPKARGWIDRYDGSFGPALDLTQAVPGYPAHPALVAHLSEAAGRPDLYAYGPIPGEPDLREAYAAEVAGLYGAPIRADDIAITTGANMAAFAATMLFCQAGDAVMLPSPWYFNNQMNAALLGVGVVPLPCRPEDGFVPDPEEAARRLTPKVRAIMLVSPNNPTGAIYPPAVIAGFADLCRRRGLALILDETYRDFMGAGEGPRPEPPHDLFRGDWAGHVVQLYSFSKSYCVPGFRAGAMVVGERLIPELTKVLDCLQICAPRIVQSGLAWGIANLGAWREENRRIMAGRAEACRRAFADLPGWSLDSQGAYFAYLRHPGRDLSSWAVAERLAAERGVVTLPGEAFGPGQERYLRLAFANVEAKRITEATGRLAGFAPQGDVPRR